MSQYLPTGAFKWMSEKNIDKLDLRKYPEDSKKRINILKVDLEYQKEFHYSHNDDPLTAEKLCVSNDVPSKYCQKIKDKDGISIGQV